MAIQSSKTKLALVLQDASLGTHYAEFKTWKECSLPKRRIFLLEVHPFVHFAIIFLCNKLFVRKLNGQLFSTGGLRNTRFHLFAVQKKEIFGQTQLKL
jgi:hypothetical protein